MSGHSHFSTIKRKKEAEDKKRGQIFSKMTQVIALAAKEGKNPEANVKLKNAIEEAKRVNLPKSLVEKAIQKGSGELGGEKLESFLFEAYGPGNISLLIEGITDNKKRALGEIKKILTENRGKLVAEGAIKWQFEKKGVILLKPENKEQAELITIDSGAENFEWQEDVLKIYTKVEKLETVKKNLDQKIEESFIAWVAKEKIQAEDITKLIESLLDNNDVQKVYSNLK
ncbi:MAG: YebC/PmpR family DNA-binding transcriptional regulator [Candidatus Pacebacteria bacterium]|nr:YebC/PmpR family DNA-binding transcriptional regulator [Candidatus Paceibacterota bacterium]